MLRCWTCAGSWRRGRRTSTWTCWCRTRRRSRRWCCRRSGRRGQQEGREGEECDNDGMGAGEPCFPFSLVGQILSLSSLVDEPSSLPPSLLLPPRWLWTSGATKGGGVVPWNQQACNTDPHLFVWEADKTVVMAMQPGLYRVAAGFYSSRNKPVVQVRGPLLSGSLCSEKSEAAFAPTPMAASPHLSRGTCLSCMR
jgi:hypothetical protein